MYCALVVSLKMWTSQRTPTPYKIKVNFRFCDENWVNSNNFIDTRSQIFGENRPSIFVCFYVWYHVSWESEFRCFASHKVEQFRLPNSLDNDKLEHVSLIQLVTSIATKPPLSGNILPDRKRCENGSSNISENLRVVTKVFELTQFASPNLWIYFNFVLCWGPLWWREISRAQSIYREVYD